MITWILTIGNSDIKLTTEDTWLSLSQSICDKTYDILFVPSRVENEDLWTVPARAVGLAYSQNVDKYYDDLCFPLLDGFTQLLQEEKIKPNEIIILLTDQSNLFDESDRYYAKSPYWKDTCTLEPLITKYLKDKFPYAKLQFLTLTPPTGSEGLDSWDSTLDLVATEIAKLNCTGSVYVSHQAGTPALSSALQFTTLSKFTKDVKFLVSNEYQTDNAQILDSSRYLRGLQIQQAKSLITTSPGAALTLLEKVNDINPEVISKLKYFVEFFNLNRSLDNQDELSLEAATQRIVDSLDLIGIFFQQSNYLQGINLLAAAQETFLKVAIILRTQDKPVNGKKGSDYLNWDNSGLVLKASYQEANEILTALNYPVSEYGIKQEKDLRNVNKNNVMFAWLKELESNFNPWNLLKWSCKYYREREQDLRNQLMHNLRGVEVAEVIEYLYGYPKSSVDTTQKLNDVYNNQVKKPFLDALNLFELPFTKEKLSKQLTDLANSLQ